MAPSSRSSKRKGRSRKNELIADAGTAEWPEYILEWIFSRLPVDARCRFRCVSQKWREFLSLPTSFPPPCMIMGKLRKDPKVEFFCQSQSRWVNLPFPRDPSFHTMWEQQEEWHLNPLEENPTLSLNWEVADVDSGLVCHCRVTRSGFKLCVRNPLTDFFEFIPLKKRNASSYGNRDRPRLKLLVGPEKKSYRVLVVMDDWCLTLIYDSATRLWDGCENTPGRHVGLSWNQLFVLQNNFYCYTMVRKNLREPVVEAFTSNKKGEWIWIRVATLIPLELDDSSTLHHISSHMNQVTLVESCFQEGMLYSIWRLRGSPASDSSSPIEFLDWERITLGGGPVIDKFFGCRLGSVCCGADYICFTFSDEKPFTPQRFYSRRFPNRQKRCVKYSFVDRSWTLIRCQRKFYQLHPWEPSFAEDAFSSPDADVRVSEMLRILN